MKSVAARGAEQTPRVSLADTGFLVVVFLLVCSIFAIEEGLVLRLPAGEAGRGRVSGDCLRVVGLESGGVEIDGRPSALDAVGSAVRTAVARNSRLVVVVEAAPGAGAALMAGILGEVRLGGATRVSLREDGR